MHDLFIPLKIYRMFYNVILTKYTFQCSIFIFDSKIEMYKCGENRWGSEEKNGSLINILVCISLVSFDLQIPTIIKHTPGLHEGSYKGLKRVVTLLQVDQG